MSSCPGEGILRSLGTDALGEGSYAAIEQHVEGCPECKAVLERLAHRRRGATVDLTGPERWPRIPGFEIQSELDPGGMSVVYLAIETGLDRLVVLKILPGTHGPDASAGPRRRWLREARAVSSVRHPNIVPLYDYGEADGSFYLVFEYVLGGTLKKRLTEPLPPRAAAELMETIAGAVGFVHGRGLLHLDLKPSNILLDCEENAPWDRVTPRVSDFGLALSNADANTSEESLAGPRGTPSYMAPEQATASRADVGAAADIHALGAILYELLTGRPPFQGASALDTLDQVRGQNPVPPRRLNPKIPRDLETIALKCLEKNPARRYVSAESLAGDLRRWLDGKPISARPASPIEHAWRWCRRRPAVAALAATLLVTLSVGFIAIVLLWRQAEANFRMSNEVLSDLVDLSIGGERYLPRAMTLERIVPVLEKERKRLLALSASLPDDLLVARQLGFVERNLCESLGRAQRYEEARTVLLESLAKLDSLARRHPADETVCTFRNDRLLNLSEVSERIGKGEDSVIYLTRAVQLREERFRLAPCANQFTGLFHNRRALAWLLHGRGDHEQAGSLFAANGRLLESLPLKGEGFTAPIERFLAHIDFKLFNEGSRWETTSDTDARGPSVSGPLSRLRSPTDASQSPEDWARLTAQALMSSNRPESADRARLDSQMVLDVMKYLTGTASRLNRVGKIGEARRVAERSHALANYFVVRRPDQPAAHLALSEAYIQLYKNASRTNDRAAVDAYMKLALGAAQEAVLRDPNSEIAQQSVYSLQRRLAGLHAKR